ncbi:MAG: glycosyl transferase family 90 [Devosia sp.]|nr:glycosyl transferase family 90 [Devosia sp.]
MLDSPAQAMPLATTVSRDLLLTALTRRNIRRHLSRLSPHAPRLATRFAETGMMPRDIRLDREGGTVVITYDAAASTFFVSCVQHFLRAYVYWFISCQPAVAAMTVTGADGDAPTLARFAPSACRDDQIAIPDPHFFDNRGYAAQRQLAATGRVPWAQRATALVWRGGYNGGGRLGFDPGDAADPTVSARIRLVMLLKDVPDTDVKLMDIGIDDGAYNPVARRLGLVGDAIPQQSWLGRKFAIDIDGTVNTWANLLIRLLYGCCVLKVGSQFGFRQWYYGELRPYEHYIPVKSDMSDLRDRWEWAMQHDAEAAAIAENGRRVAERLTFEQGTADAVRLISAHWQD